MTHLSENCNPLVIRRKAVQSWPCLTENMNSFNGVCAVLFPLRKSRDSESGCCPPKKILTELAEILGPDATLICTGEPADLVHAHTALSSLHYQIWISIRRENPKYAQDSTFLPECHFGSLIHTKYRGSLKHTLTRILYSHCPACGKSTKDYGGKKHTYNSYGTLMSDVWRDIACDLEEDLSPVLERFADLFGLEPYRELRVLDCRFIPEDTKNLLLEMPSPAYRLQKGFADMSGDAPCTQSRLIQGDCLETLKNIRDCSADFAFIDPPYNLRKTYSNYSDDLSVREYFAWCDQWISEAARILRPGRTFALLNIPLWAIRHFLHMETILKFQNWISWDALSFPVRKIMPAHYAILCFTKGNPRPLPGLTGRFGTFDLPVSSGAFLPLEPLAEGYCLRAGCIKKRNHPAMTDRGLMTDLWGDIHRLKHNSRRVDHPCQLPPQLLYRLILLFTEPGETVVDCFNGAGTTTLAAQQCGRKYIGIEISEKYYEISRMRHEEIRQGLDPFRKDERDLTEKNSRVARMPKKKYEISKKTLQLEVRRVARELGCLPKREDMIKFGKYPISYYDEYFFSWGEVCAAARHEGMSETGSENFCHPEEKAEQMLFQTGLFSN